MNKKLDKVRENIRKTEKQMRELDEYLKTLRLQEKQLEDEEIIKQIRSLNTKCHGCTPKSTEHERSGTGSTGL